MHVMIKGELVDLINIDKVTALRLKLEAQVADSKNYREIACQILGTDEISDGELLTWYVDVGLAAMFGLEWQIAIDELNLYYTSVEIGREPTPVEGLRHWRYYLVGITIRTENKEEEVTLAY